MSIQLLAILLLVGHAITMTFNIVVLRKQWKIRNIPTHPRIEKIRGVLSMLAIVIFVANFYPVWLDLVTLWEPGIRTAQVINLKGVIYTLDNNLGFLFASVFIWALYKLSDVAIQVGELVAGDPPTPAVLKPKKK